MHPSPSVRTNTLVAKLGLPTSVKPRGIAVRQGRHLLSRHGFPFFQILLVPVLHDISDPPIRASRALHNRRVDYRFGEPADG